MFGSKLKLVHHFCSEIFSPAVVAYQQSVSWLEVPCRELSFLMVDMAYHNIPAAVIAHAELMWPLRLWLCFQGHRTNITSIYMKVQHEQ